jgi:hypothetical protein
LLVTTGVATLPQSITVLLVQQQAQQVQQRGLLLQRVQQQGPQLQQVQVQQRRGLQRVQRLLLFCHKQSKRTQPTRQLRELIFS